MYQKNKYFFTFILPNTVYGSTFFVKLIVTYTECYYVKGTDSFLMLMRNVQNCIMLSFFCNKLFTIGHQRLGDYTRRGICIKFHNGSTLFIYLWFTEK